MKECIGIVTTLYRKCHKYKTKLTLLLRPFEQIRFDDENIYLQKL